MEHGDTKDLEDRTLLDLLLRLDERMSRVEAALNLPPVETTAPPGVPSRVDQETGLPEKAAERAENSGIEVRIGEFGLAWFGSVILMLGMAFLMTYTYSLGYRAVACLLGYLAAFGFYLVAHLWEKTAGHLARLMICGSLVLLYFATLRLHYFSSDPLLANAHLALTALLLIVGVQFYLAIRRNSQIIAGLAMILAILTGLLSNTPAVGLSLLVLISALVAYLTSYHGWLPLLSTTILFVYAGHLVWLLNDPVLGRPMGAISPDQYSMLYLFLCAAIFFVPALARKASAESAVTVVLLNSLGFFLLVSLAAFAVYRKNLVSASFAVASFFLICSIIQWLKTHRQIAPAIYACFGYLALSVAVYEYSGVPSVFLWLSLQSLLVVSMALWFRSKILVVTNSIIFLFILALYVAGFPSSDWVNFSFALVGHASARVMNWQKERLTLRTEMLRNIYLIIGFVFVLYTLYHIVPGHYITLSWMAVAISYFLISILLRNIKYRWLSIASVLVTISYLFLFDLARLDPKYRVPAFLFVGIAALVISLYYTKLKRLLGKEDR
jgi:uncharacterized membrane protein